MTVFGKLLTLISILVLVLFGYIITSYKKGVSVEEEQATTTEQVAKKIPFSQLLEQKGTYVCDVEKATDGNTSKGVVYIAEERIRGIFTVATGENNFDSNILILNGYTYTWMSHIKGNGYKIKNKELIPGATTTEDTSYTWDPSSVGDYSCKEWSLDENMFTLPKDVTFVEVKK
jgi:hypothetical protein